MTITEPATLLTDYLLAALTIYFAVMLWRMARSSRYGSQQLWVAAFIGFALASFLGGSWHGFHTMLSSSDAQLLWRLTTGIIGLAGSLLLVGALYATIDNRWRDRLVRIMRATNP